MNYTPEEIRKAAQALSARYREGTPPFLRSPIDRHAYLLTRFPATQAALYRVFHEIKPYAISSLLDIGAGPGTSWKAATETWATLHKATCVERDTDFIAIGRAMTPADQVVWTSSSKTFEQHDLVLFSYSWGEILSMEILARAWEAAKQFLVVVEPGTPQGYHRMLQARDFCIQHGGCVQAPCPHSRACPWEKSEEWCHFSVRLERSAEHRLAKEGALGYEDEKFSYVIVGKQKLQGACSRLVKDPVRRKGHTLLTLCTEQGIEKHVVTKKDKEMYKRVNKLRWGDKISGK
jgi:ribosomal protein RSM22 (predicted rRNA methylase)